MVVVEGLQSTRIRKGAHHHWIAWSLSRIRGNVGAVILTLSCATLFLNIVALRWFHRGDVGTFPSTFVPVANKIPLLLGKEVPLASSFVCERSGRAAGHKRRHRASHHLAEIVPPESFRVVGGFPATPILGNGFLDTAEGEHFSSVLFRGRASKFPNGPILSTGSSLVVGADSPVEYRMMYLEASLNYSAIQNDEAVESDVCVTIVPGYKQNSVSSGEEVFCTHEHYFGGDVFGGSGIETPIMFDFGPSGLWLPPDHKLIIASVSKIFTRKQFVPLSKEALRKRDAPPHPVEVPGVGSVATSLSLLALHFEVLLVPSTNQHVAPHAPLRSVRSPLRDRSFFPMANTEVLPLTMYRNAMSDSVILRGLGIFRSILNHYTAGDTLVTVIVDGKEVVSMCPDPQLPGEASASFEAVLPLDLTVPPNGTVRVENRVATYMPGQTAFMPTPYDFAVYLLYEHPDITQDALVPMDEWKLGESKLDLNDDGHPDFVDYDTHGHIWVELTSPDGSHDTQHSPVECLITKWGKFDAPTTEWTWSRDPVTKLPSAKVQDDVNQICFHLRSIKPANATFEYCDESAVAPVDVGFAPNACVGDFDGDGHFDRVRMEPPPDRRGVFHSLYFAKGDGRSYQWERLVATIQAECEGDRPTMVSNYRYSLKRHVFGYFTMCGGWQWREIDSSMLLPMGKD